MFFKESQIFSIFWQSGTCLSDICNTVHASILASIKIVTAIQLIRRPIHKIDILFELCQLCLVLFTITHAGVQSQGPSTPRHAPTFVSLVKGHGRS